MKNKIEILDCTLRDGGYYTNWDFDKEFVTKYLKTMEDTESIKIVELGYRSLSKENYLGEYYYCPKYFLEEAREIAPSKILAIMLNEKDVTINDLYIIDDCVGNVDLIRLAVNPINLKRALLLATKIKEKGFKVAINLMYMSEWANDKKFLSSLKDTEGKVDYLYLVDSFGSADPEEVFKLVCNITNFTSTPIGFHGHNNLELALINSLKALEAGCSIVDVTISGMGRGAGNLSTELLLTYLSSKNAIDFNLTKFSEIVSKVEELKSYYKWGVSFPYIISGAYSLPQSDVMNWIAKERHDINSIVNALQNKKNKLIDNIKLKIFKNHHQFNSALIIGGGTSVKKHIQVIKKYLSLNTNVALIHAGCRNFELFKDLNVQQFVCLAGSESNKFDLLKISPNSIDIKLIIAPYPREMGTFLPENFDNNIFELGSYTFTKKYYDSPFAIALQLALEVNADKVDLIGFDGYNLNSSNKMLQVINENQYLIDNFNLKSNIKINSFTLTTYSNTSTKSIFCNI